jgi:hypothetical protein
VEDVMAKASDKKRWDDLHAAYANADRAAFNYELELGTKYGHNFSSSWLSRAQRDKLDRLRAKKDQIGDKIIELLVRVSPRGDRWLSGVPSWWIREKLTWEDAIRPANEPLSVVVPGAWGSRDGHVSEHRTRENRMMKKKDSASEFKDFLEKSAIIVTGDGDVIDLGDSESVRVAIMVNVTGYGPHVGAIYAMQRGHEDEALQEAEELLEEWERDHYPDSEVDDETRRETFDGRVWTLDPKEFADAVERTSAVSFVDIAETDKDELDEEDLEEEEEELEEEESDKESSLEESRRPGVHERPDLIVAYWDTSDPNNVGWAWRAFWYDEHDRVTHEESGEFEGRSNLSPDTITSRARKAAGHGGSRVPVEIRE